jgi:hypothetical protein
MPRRVPHDTQKSIVSPENLPPHDAQKDQRRWPLLVDNAAPAGDLSPPCGGLALIRERDRDLLDTAM